MVRDFSTAYGIHFAILRYFNAAGADAEAQTGSAYKVDTHIIPLLMKVASGMMPAIKLFGEDYDTEDGTAVRDYVHVSDLAQAHILAMEHILKGNENLTINIGNSAGFSVAQVIDAAKKVTGRAIAVEKSPRRAGDPAVLVADSARAKKVLGWTAPLSDLETIIGTAWAWRQKQNGG
jgi:UDP-glucose 4-epimerase